MRLLIVSIALFLFVINVDWITGQPPDRPHRPLDLPAGGGVGDEAEEEDMPELIQFWGEEYEGDAFFWCLDKSALTTFIECPEPGPPAESGG